jgi:hypothetical protein
LQSVEVTLLGDVRTVPRSRTNPRYNREALPDSLRPHGTSYEHMAVLRGLRSRVREVAPTINEFWANESFHNYADYAMGERFREGLARICAASVRRSVAPSCARKRCGGAATGESSPTICWPPVSRFFISFSAGKIEPAVINAAAWPQRSDLLVYPVDRTASD